MLEVFKSLLMLCTANPEHRNASPRALWAKQNRARWPSVHMRIKKNLKLIGTNPLDTRCFGSYDDSAVMQRGRMLCEFNQTLTAATNKPCDLGENLRKRYRLPTRHAC
jgi:hypothetical protein